MTFSSLVVLFTICSFAGWLFESFYAVISRGKWDRRGFLYGPVCPIYGVGVVAIVLLVGELHHLLGFGYEWWQVFLIGFFGSMVLEYATSVALERLFHAYWWDYSNMPLNLNGRICVPAAALFGAGGLLAIYVIYPWWMGLSALIPSIWIEIAAYAIIVIMTIDATLTVSALTDFDKMVSLADETFNSRAEEFTKKVVGNYEGISSIADKMVEGAADASQALEDAREQLIRRRLTSRLRQMGSLRTSALERVKGFRDATRPEATERLAAILKTLDTRNKEK